MTEFRVLGEERIKYTVKTVADYKEIVDEIKANGGEAFDRCYECGLCDAVCPWNRVINFSMRRVVRQATFGMTDIENEDIWRCTTCGSCPQQCPRNVRQIDSGISLRRLATEYGVFPNPVKPLRGVSASLVGVGNPLGEDRQARADWAQDLSVKAFTEPEESGPCHRNDPQPGRDRLRDIGHQGELLRRKHPQDR